MGYSEPRIVICRRTGEVVGTLQTANIKHKGIASVVYWDKRCNQTEVIAKAIFDVNFRIEDCK